MSEAVTAGANRRYDIIPWAAQNALDPVIGLVPAIHDLFAQQRQRTWMPGTSPGMTARGSGGFGGLRRRET